MKTIIAGSRSCNNYDVVKKAIIDSEFDITTVISGGAFGVDTLGERYAKEHGIEVVRFLPDWDTFGKRAGILRNRQMADNADALIAIWDGVSRGTKHMIETARFLGLKVFVMRI